MDNTTSKQDKLVFGLDIGTRTIVGVVGYMERNRFRVVAMAEQMHETRAMLDGQIHDIYKVGDTIRRVKNMLEKQLERELSDVCIAAAGRVLRTVNASAEVDLEEETRVTAEQIYSLNLLAVEKAHTQINEQSTDVRFYCVGNTPISYSLNGYDIINLEGHKANRIGVELIATFLPEEVVDGLYEAVEYAGLHVASLTLEPIAAISIAIPEQFRLLNIGLIDVGAGTSDICITKDGSVIAYGMIPYAGDEITERIAKNYLVDFNTAEKIKMSASTKKKGLVTFKDVMGLTQKVQAADIRAVADDVIELMAKETAGKIVELNGGKPVNAVFVVGGGGKMTGYTDKIADELNIPHERVAVRGQEVLTSVDFDIEDFKKDSLYVTPIGICTNYYNQKNNFVFVTVNKERIKLYDTSNLTVVDAIMQVGFPNEKLFPRRGKEITFTVNGKTRLVRGSAGEGAVVTLNGKITNLNALIEQNDVIEIKESTTGEAASITIGQLEEFNAKINFIVNDKNIVCPRFAYVNGELKSEFYDINDGDKIRMENFYSLAQLLEFMDYDLKDFNVLVNNEPADKHTRVYENFSVKLSPRINDENDAVDKVLNEENADTEIDENTFADEDAESNVDTTEDAVYFKKSARVNKPEPAATSITITVNGMPVKLTGKSTYILVDLFQFYDFDLSTPKGNVVIKHNGRIGVYTAPLSNSDVVEVYWE